MTDTVKEYITDNAITNAEQDNEAVDEFAKAMKEKLAKARAKGRKGWDDKEACSDENLAYLFHDHLQKHNEGNFIDLANFLMFLHIRGAKPDVLSLVKERFLGIMTREDAKKELDELEVAYGVYDIVEIIFDEHEAQLKAKDEEIERLKAQSSSVHNLMYRNGYNDAIDCYDTFGNFNTKHKPNAKARKIVAMLGKNWKKSRQFLGKNDEVTVSDQIAFIDAIAILKHKG